jgi:hypothetical protein
MALAKTRHPRPKRVGKNSTFGEKTAVRMHGVFAQIFGGRTVLKLIGTMVGIVLIVGGIFWYKQVYSSPENVFWGMINNNLSTYSITKEISQSGTSATNKEDTQLGFSPSPVVRDIKDISTQNSANSSRIKIESIGTPTDTYQHYVLIDQSSKSGKKKPDYSRIYSMWLKNSGSNQRDTQLFDNIVYSALLFGNLPPTQRNDTVNYIRNAYHVDFAHVAKNTSGGRRTYTYNVKLGLRSFAQAANFYSKTLGLPKTGQIKAENYKPTEEVALKIKVDVLSRQAKNVQYLSNGSVETYTTYGIVPTFKPPAHTVSYQTLQQAVQTAAKQ